MTQPQKPKILCVGRLYCDLIFTDLPRMPTAGTEVFCGGVGFHAGGGAAITAGHLVEMGHQSYLASWIPKAPFGDLLVKELEAAGADLALSQRQETSDPQMTAALVHRGDRAFVTHRAGSAFPDFGSDDVIRHGFQHIHIGEATTLIEAPDLIGLAQEAKVSLSLDCSWDDQIDAAELARLLPEIDVFLPNADEVSLLHVRGVSETLPRLTVVKQGSNGATALTQNGEVHAPAEPTEVVDTTGAGDAFNAGFLSTWLQGGPIRACLQFGNAKGAWAVAHRGGLGGLFAKGHA